MVSFQSFTLDEIPEEELIKALKHQLDYMNETESGITRQFLVEGFNSLSDKQSYVFITNVVPTLTELCGTNNCKTRIYSGEGSCPSCQIEYNL